MSRIFNQLKGINKEREIKKQDNINLEWMIEATKSALKIAYKKDCVDEITRLMAGCNYDEDDLKDFIALNYNSFNDGSLRNYFLGQITGYFLDDLTVRNRKIGRWTRIEIDGKGQSFECLFSGASNIDELILRNLKTRFICEDLGYTPGIVDTVALINIKDDYMISGLGYSDSKIKNLILIGNKGDSILEDCGSQIEFLLALKNDTCMLGYNLSLTTEGIGQIVLVDNKLIASSYDLWDNTNKKIIMSRNIIEQPYENFRYEEMIKRALHNGAKGGFKKRIGKLAREIDPNDTDQLLSQVYKIKEEMGRLE